MNRLLRRASLANGRKLQKLTWDNFEECTYEAMQKHHTLNPESDYSPDMVFKNNRFIVQIFNNRPIIGKPATKMMIRRSDSQAIYSWPDLQRIKNELFGEDAMAIQLFPPQEDLIDEANIYWLYVLEETEQ